MYKTFRISFAVVLLSFCSVVSAWGQLQEAIRWSYSINDKAEIVFRTSIDYGWHLYDIDQPEGGPNPTVFHFEKISGAERLGKVTTAAKITTKFDETFEMNVSWYNGNPTFVQRLRVTDAEKFAITGYVDYMTCNDESCLPGQLEFSLTKKDLPAVVIASVPRTIVKKNTHSEEDSVAAGLTHNPLPASINEEEIASQTDTSITEEGIAGQNRNDKPGGYGRTTSDDKATENSNVDFWKPVIAELQALGESQTDGDNSLWSVFWLCFVGGLLALLTPCVWPIIPMTVSFFLKRSKSNRTKAVRDALIYGLSIIVIYLGLGLLVTVLFGASALNDLSTNAVFNLIFFALLVLFAVSFLGAFELTLPSSWSSKMDSKAEATTGILSIFFMAFTLVLVSFSCTGPIIGGLLVEAASMGSLAGPAVGMFGFGLALAIPFALFAIFPSMLQKMPKSGGWLNTVKVVLGFLELALALKFLSVADLAYGWHILDRETFLALWIVIFALLGVYLLGKIRFAHDDEVQHVSVSHFFMAVISFAFAIYMVPGLWGAPLKAISAFSPPLYTQDFNLYDGEVLPKFHDYDEGMAYARRHNKPAMLDFTGYGCVNCRKMEAAVWSNPRVKSILNNDYVLISLYVDDKTKLPEPILIEEDGKETKLRTIGDKWSYLQRHKFGANAQPYYVLVDNDGLPLAPWYAFDEDVDKYVQFLRDGLKK
ncbi:cytochrome c-type biogenesis protein DsbD, protein-disulfide reductase [Candidatus Symbiothrix dinenymphae]|nr:cytochrome c-type biogenesis protein DsbD, protein-disulfide reductase [Candidatus Symbiothrix dinenymphae]